MKDSKVDPKEWTHYFQESGQTKYIFDLPLESFELEYGYKIDIRSPKQLFPSCAVDISGQGDIISDYER